MARNALVLGFVSLVLAAIGLFIYVPVVGSLIRLGSPLAGVAGIVLGGMALRDKGNQGDSNGSALALAGLAMSILGFLIGMVVFVACSAGACAAEAAGNAVEASAQHQAP